MAENSKQRFAFAPESVRKFIESGIVSLPIDFRDRSVPLLKYFEEQIVGLPKDIKKRMEIDMGCVQECHEACGQENPYLGMERTDFGLYFRDDKRKDGTPGDKKWVFHVRPMDDIVSLRRLYQERKIELPQGFWEWHDASHSLMEDIMHYTRCFLEAVDRECGTDMSFSMFHESAMRMHVFRFLYYLPKTDGKEYADRHCDFGLITAQLAESHPGLQFQPHSDNPETWIDYYNKVGQTVFFGGRRMTTATSGRIPGVPHRVLKLPASRGGPRDDEPRTSMIVFLHGPFQKGPSCPS